MAGPATLTQRIIHDHLVASTDEEDPATTLHGGDLAPNSERRILPPGGLFAHLADA